VLYGIGARLDREPGLLFTLRKVQEDELVGGAGTRAAAGLAARRTTGTGTRKVVDENDLAGVFDLDIAPPSAPAKAPAKPRRPARAAKTTSKTKSRRTSQKKPKRTSTRKHASTTRARAKAKRSRS